jgi:uncharacterized repeat protein (TIGR03803 family)
MHPAKRFGARRRACALACGIALFLLAAAIPRAHAQFNVVHDFSCPTDGCEPQGRLLDVNGTLYGTTLDGGANQWGTLFKIVGSTYTVLYNFGTDASNPCGGLVMIAGNVYGTTETGGKYGRGAVYEITPSGAKTMLYSFGTTGDGMYPTGGLVFSPLNGGAFYGTTLDGGAHSLGTVFAITLSGVEKWLYSFAGRVDGANPQSSLFVQGGWLYGTAMNGGASSLGTVFRIMNTGAGMQTLYSFPGGANGAAPISDVIVNPVDNAVYGTTALGGFNDGGVVFALNASSGFAYSVIHTFQGTPNDGYSPYGGLVLVTPGVIYGTTSAGGTYNQGALFKIIGTSEQIESFFPTVDGRNPAVDLTLDSSGRYLYGTALLGGTNNVGTVFNTPIP